MDHLQRTGERQRAAPVAAADPAEFQRQHRADPLAAGKQTVAHGVKQPLLRQILTKLPLQKFFDGSTILRNLVPKFTHRVHTPFLPAYRRRFLSV